MIYNVNLMFGLQQQLHKMSMNKKICSFVSISITEEFYMLGIQGFDIYKSPVLVAFSFFVQSQFAARSCL